MALQLKHGVPATDSTAELKEQVVSAETQSSALKITREKMKFLGRDSGEVT